MSLLSEAVALHLDRLNAGGSVQITFSRNLESVTLSATPASTTFEAFDQFGNVIQIVSQDFIIKQSDLMLGGVMVTPERNDQITQEINGTDHEFRLLTDFGLPHYRATDAYGTGWRIHTKRIDG